MLIAALALTLGSVAQVDAPATADAETGIAWSSDLAVAPLMARRNDEAISLLERAKAENPDDAAVLINLGIAYAQIGQDEDARALFTAALTKRTATDLATSGGRVTDSRQLARRALRMLDHGQFRAKPGNAGQLTLRD